MGYRPTIICNGFEKEFKKFYGYVNLENLDSIKWLINHKKINEDKMDCFNYLQTGPEIVFTAEEFKEFIELYLKDKINNGFDISHEKHIFIELSNNDFSKTIEWS